MINYDSLWYEAWNSSGIRHHFSTFDKLAKTIKHYKQSFDDWTVIIHDYVMNCRWHSLPHKVSALSYYDAEEGYRNIGLPFLYMIPEDCAIEDIKTGFEFECDFVIEKKY